MGTIKFKVMDAHPGKSLINDSGFSFITIIVKKWKND
jgi:hypothetical protein